MSIFSSKNSFSSKTSRNISRGAAALAVAAGLSLAAGAALADDPTTMAPPIGASSPEGIGGLSGTSGVNASADSVFNWQEIPADQQVPLTRATFDQGGYQLYDTQGETIVVPFTNQNLYVMKFATSSDGTLYFENRGGFPVLYVPQGGFVENATVAGARWYPFGQDFHPAEPVFLGIAPSYTDFIDLGWYPNTRFYGGYYGHTSFLEGGLFLPTLGLFFSIGGHPYYGWNSYHHYYEGHPGYVHVHYYDHNFYHFAGSNYRTFAPNRRFGDFHSDGFHGNGSRDGGNRYYHAGGSYHGNYTGHAGIVGRPGSGFGERSGFSGRTFRGATGFSGGHSDYSGGHSGSTGGHSYGGGHSYSGGGSYGGGTRTFGGGSHSDGGSSQTYTHSFRGTSSGGGQSFGGARTFGGGGQSFGGGHSSYSNNSSSSGHSDGGSHSFSGGQRSRASSSGGGGGRQNNARQDNAKQDGGGHGGGGHDGGGRSR